MELMMLQERKLILVTRKTRLQELKEKYCTLGQAKFYIEHLGERFDDYVAEDALYIEAQQNVLTHLKQAGRVQVLERSMLATYLFAQDDIIIVLGQDGLVANTLKYLRGQPLIAINPIPELFDGILLPFYVSDTLDALNNVLCGRMATKSISMAQVTTNLGDTILAVNDIFIGPKSHTSARYEICVGDKNEQQSSSGVIVSTGLGSTGWFKSILAGASGIAQRPLHKRLNQGLAWDSTDLFYTVREPFPSAVTQTNLVFGKISNGMTFKLTSKMAENGVIFSDGIEQDAVKFNAGTTANITLSQHQGSLVVDN
jgi:NAD kinase